MPLSKIAMRSEDICSSATTPRVYASTIQSICGSVSSPLSRLALIISTAANGSVMGILYVSWSGPKAHGKISDIGRGPAGVMSKQFAPPCSKMS